MFENICLFYMQVFPPPEEFAKKAHIKSMDQYKTMYKQSIDDPEGFWKDIAKEFHFEGEKIGCNKYEYEL